MSHPDDPEITLPNTVDELIDLLDTRAFPLRNFPVSADFAAIQRECGKRDVVDFLRALQHERDDRTEERVFNPSISR